MKIPMPQTKSLPIARAVVSPPSSPGSEGMGKKRIRTMNTLQMMNMLKKMISRIALLVAMIL